MDRLTPEQRRKNMQAIKNKDSKIELKLRKELWKKGLRYRKNVRGVFGHPDIAFIKNKVAIFCDSEFWHGYDWANTKSEIKTRREFWIPKIEKNIQRDEVVNKTLENDGWIVLRFWGKEIEKNLQTCVETIEKVVKERK